MEWKKYYETGIQIVDEQHKELFRQVGILVDYDQKKETRERIEETLNFLGEYVLRHFGTEEMMQKMLKYPKADQHKEMHEKFVQAFVELKQEYAVKGENLLVLMKLTKVAIDWLQDHILKQDKDFGEYYHAQKSNGAVFADAKEKGMTIPD